MPLRSETQDPAADAAGLLLRIGIGVLALALPCASVASRRPIFVLLPLGAVLVMVGGLLTPRSGLRRHLSVALTSPLTLIVLALLAWAGLSLVWTPLPQLAAQRFFRMAGLVLVAAGAVACLPDHVKASNSNLLPIGLSAAALALVGVALAAPAAAGVADPDGNTLQRAAVALVTLIWPALGALALRERVASAGLVAVAVALGVGVVWTPQALVALIVGLLVFAVAYSDPKLTGRALAFIAAGFVLAAPLIPLAAQTLPAPLHSIPALEGLFAWGGVERGEGLRLITGHGFDAAVRALIAGLLPSATPRGLLFEVWYELGVMGALGVAWALWRAFRAGARAPGLLAPFVLAAEACVFTLAVSGIALAQLWWVALIATMAVMFAIVLRGMNRSERVRAPVGVRVEPPPL